MLAQDVHIMAVFFGKGGCTTPSPDKVPVKARRQIWDWGTVSRGLRLRGKKIDIFDPPKPTQKSDNAIFAHVCCHRQDKNESNFLNLGDELL